MKYLNLDVHTISGKLKNKIHVGGKEGAYQDFVEKYSRRYDANKAHSKFHFLRFLKALDCEHMIKDIKKKNVDDAADSIMQSIAWIFS